MNLSGRKRGIQFFCPLCHQQQGTNSIEKISPRHFLQMGVATAVFTITFWSITGLKGIVSYLFFWAAFEFAYRVRKRHALVCRNCGFDPFLYELDKKMIKTAVPTD